MKILFLTNIPSPYRVDFFNELGKYCELTVIYELEKATDRDVDWVLDSSEQNYNELFLKPVIKGTSSAWCPSVGRFLKRGRYDIVIVGGYSTPTGMQAVWQMRRRKLPYFLNCDGGFIPNGENRLKYYIKKYFISGAVGWLSSGKLADEYLSYYGAAPGRIFRYPFTSLRDSDILPKMLSASEKQEYKAKLGIGEEKILLAVGQFIPRKGFDLLLQAAAQLKTPCGVYVIGGHCTQEYSQIIRKYQLKHIHFLPFMKQEKLREYYLAADIFVFPTREDIWGLVINEAMAAGLPVITTNRCGAGVELLDEKYLVPAENADSLAHLSEELLENDILRLAAGSANLSKIREYTMEKMGKAHMDILNRWRQL